LSAKKFGFLEPRQKEYINLFGKRHKEMMQ